MAAGGRAGLYGREEELARLGATFAGGARIVTLTGAPGVGKSRLARALAETWAGEVVACEMWDSRPEDWLLRIAAVLQLDPREPDLPGRVGLALAARKQALLLLDDFDRLVAEAVVVGAWLRAAPELRLLVTSREPLHLREEHVLPLSPMAEGDARALLDARVAQLAPTAPPPSASPALAQALIDSVDRLPLGLELAASWLRVLPLAAVVERVRQEPTWLRADLRDVPEHHRSLRAALALSWALLEPEGRAALARLAVLPGPFDVTLALHALGGDAEAALAQLTQLADRSLVEVAPGDERVYRLLTSVRAMAQEQSDAATRAAALAALADHLLDLARGALRRGWPASVDAALVTRVLDAQLATGDARAADLAVAAADLLDTGLPAAARDALAARLVAAAAEPARQARLLVWQAQAARARAHQDEAIAALRAAVDLARGRDPAALAAAAAPLGASLDEAGKVTEGQALIDEAIAAALASGDRDLACDTYLFASRPAFQRQDYAAAERLIREAARHRPDEPGPLADLHDLHEGTLLDCVGRLPEAEAVYRRLLASPSASPLVRVYSRAHLAGLRFELGADDEAGALVDEAIARARRLGQTRALAIALVVRAHVDVVRGRLVDAAVAADEADRLAGQAADGARQEWARALGLLVRALRGDPIGPPAAPPAGYLAATITLLHELTGLHRARLAHEAGDGAGALAELDRLAAAIRRRPTGPGEVRMAARVGEVLGQRLRAELSTLVVGPGAAWVQPPGAPRVSLTRHAAARAILWRLVQARRLAPGTPVDPDQLIAAGWPDERILPDAARTRLHTAVKQLRDLGLRDVLQRESGGYLLAADVPLDLG